MDCRSKERRRPISWSRSKPRVNPLLAKENPHEEREGHKRLLVSTAFHKRCVGYRREIVFLARWLAEVHKDPAPALVNSRLTLPDIDPLHFSHGAAICECHRKTWRPANPRLRGASD